MPNGPIVKDPPSQSSDTPGNPRRRCGYLEDSDQHGNKFILLCIGPPNLKRNEEVKYDLKDAVIELAGFKIKLAVIKGL